jgi:hypothetical protein
MRVGGWLIGVIGFEKWQRNGIFFVSRLVGVLAGPLFDDAGLKPGAYIRLDLLLQKGHTTRESLKIDAAS